MTVERGVRMPFLSVLTFLQNHLLTFDFLLIKCICLIWQSMRREYTKIFANQQNTYIIEWIKLVSVTSYEISQKVKNRM